MSPNFTLVVVASEDGFIARRPGHAPQEWASREEQDLFLAKVDAADWGIMGRGTHEAALRPERRRIVFSRRPALPDWRAPHQVWVDPATQTPASLAALVDPVRPLVSAVILGGTEVHDWFLARKGIDRVLLTVEPVEFGAGLPIFSGFAGAPDAVFRSAGFEPVSERALNDDGTRLLEFRPRRP